MARTEIATMGEFGLIRHLTKDLKPVQPSTKKAAGDDCAVMDFNKVQGDKVQSTKDKGYEKSPRTDRCEGIFYRG